MNTLQAPVGMLARPIAIVLIALSVFLGRVEAAYADLQSCAAIRDNNVNVKMFGAVGDGSTDDSDSIASAARCFVSILDNDPSHSAVLYFPSGTYVLRAPISLEERMRRGGQPVRWQGITIRGDGDGETRILTDRPGGIFAINSPRFAGTIEISSIRLATTAAGAGAAILISADMNGRPIAGVREKLALYAHDMTITGERDGYFQYGLYTASIKRTLIDGVKVDTNGSKTPAGTACFYLTDTYGPTLTNSSCNGMRRGIVLASRLPPAGEGQGFFISNSQFRNVDVAIDSRTHGNQPAGFIAYNSINATVSGIYLVNKKFILIHDNNFYTSASGDYTDIHFDQMQFRRRNMGNQKSIIWNNTFHSRSANPRRVGIKFTGYNSNMIVVSNVFQSFGTAISVGAESAGTIIQKNTFLTSRSVVDDGEKTYIRN